MEKNEKKYYSLSEVKKELKLKSLKDVQDLIDSNKLKCELFISSDVLEKYKNKTAQIVSKDRVVNQGEVYTNPREVKAMCDLVDNAIIEDRYCEKNQTDYLSLKYLEPAVGKGAFTLEILDRKLKEFDKVMKKLENKGSSIMYKVNMIKIAASIFSVDIIDDNVEYCRKAYYEKLAKKIDKTNILTSEEKTKLKNYIKYIFDYNTVWGNTLTMYTMIDNDTESKDPIKFLDVTVDNPTGEYRITEIENEFLNENHLLRKKLGMTHREIKETIKERKLSEIC